MSSIGFLSYLLNRKVSGTVMSKPFHRFDTCCVTSCTNSNVDVGFYADGTASEDTPIVEKDYRRKREKGVTSRRKDSFPGRVTIISNAIRSIGSIRTFPVGYTF